MSEERLTDLLHRITPEPPPSIDLTRLAHRIVDDSALHTPSRARRRLVPALIAAAAIGAVALATITVVSHRADDFGPSSGGGGGPAPTGKEINRAKATLDRWDKVIGDNAYVPIAPRSGHGSNPATWQFQQLGDWPATTANLSPDAVAMALRNITTKSPLSADRPPAGQVMWSDGKSVPLRPLSPAETLQQLRSGADICVGCKPGELDGVKAGTLVIDTVTLTTMKVQTTRGPATVPAYRFSFVGKAVRVLQAAAAPAVAGPLPEKGQVNLPIESATVGADPTTVTVHFTGAKLGAAQPCGADYSAFAAESDRAVAVILTTKPHAKDENCPSDSGPRTAVIHLKHPLNGRAVLETAHGTAVAVTG